MDLAFLATVSLGFFLRNYLCHLWIRLEREHFPVIVFSFLFRDAIYCSICLHLDLIYEACELYFLSF